MDIFIAILWYLQVLFTGTQYTTDQIDQMVIDNQPSVDAVMQDAVLLDNVVTTFNDGYNITNDATNGTQVIETDQEKDEDFEPIPF